jgi:membrane-bound lytic murein transglycosylase D
LTAGEGLDAGDELVIPVASAVAAAGPQRYAVRRGDTLITVADRFGVSVEELRRWNHLSSNVVKPGSSLAVAEPVKLAPITHVRAKKARGKSSSHAVATSVHATSTHTDPKHSTTTSRQSSKSVTKITPAKKQNSAPKAK